MRVTSCRATALALILLLGPEAEAHQFTHPKILRLGIKHDRLLLSLSYDINPGEDSRRIRSLFDRDSDGALDETERQKLARYLEETATLWMKMTLDGEPAKLERLEVAPSRLDAPAGSTDSVGIAILYALALPSTASISIALFDRDKDRTRHVPLTIDLDPEWVVAYSSQGELYPKSRQIQRVALRPDMGLELRLRRAKR